MARGTLTSGPSSGTSDNTCTVDPVAMRGGLLGQARDAAEPAEALGNHHRERDALLAGNGNPDVEPQAGHEIRLHDPGADRARDAMFGCPPYEVVDHFQPGDAPQRRRFPPAQPPHLEKHRDEKAEEQHPYAYTSMLITFKC